MTTLRTGRCSSARGNLSYLSGDVDTAWEVASRARTSSPRRWTHGTSSTWSPCKGPSAIGGASGSSGSGRSFAVRRATSGSRLPCGTPTSASREWILYGPVPYMRLIADTGSHGHARRGRAIRGVASATALIEGGLPLLMGASNVPGRSSRRQLSRALGGPVVRDRVGRGRPPHPGGRGPRRGPGRRPRPAHPPSRAPVRPGRSREPGGGLPRRGCRGARRSGLLTAVAAPRGITRHHAAAPPEPRRHGRSVAYWPRGLVPTGGHTGGTVCPAPRRRRLPRTPR
jgi:hypothetical protein